MPGVGRVERVRARAAGNMIPIEVGLRAIRHEVANHIRFSIDRAHPLAHVHPVALDSESITDTVRLIAAASNFFVSGIDVHEVDGVRHVELELEVSMTA